MIAAIKEASPVIVQLTRNEPLAALRSLVLIICPAAAEPAGRIVTARARRRRHRPPATICLQRQARVGVLIETIGRGFEFDRFAETDRQRLRPCFVQFIIP